MYGSRANHKQTMSDLRGINERVMGKFWGETGANRALKTHVAGMVQLVGEAGPASLLFLALVSAVALS